MSVRILHGDCRQVLPTLSDQSVNCIVTSPPYFGLRDYGVDGQLGLEATPDAYVAEMVGVFREARRVLRDDGVAFVNLGDSYASHGPGGYRPGEFLNLDGRQSEASKGARNRSGTYVAGMKRKDLIGIPWLLAFALRADGWYLRSEIIWHKPNPMPESVRDRPTKAHEQVFLLSKRERYFYDIDAVREPNTSADWYANHKKTIDKWSAGYGDGGTPGGGKNTGLETNRYNSDGRNRRSVWTIATEPSPLPHFAMMPTALAELCIKAGCPQGGIVLDPFSGVGTTGLVADRLGRNAVLIELNPDSTTVAETRLSGDAGMFASVRLETAGTAA